MGQIKGNVTLSLEGLHEIHGFSTDQVIRFHQMANDAKKGMFVKDRKNDKTYFLTLDSSKATLYRLLVGLEETIEKNMDWSVKRAIGMHCIYNGKAGPLGRYINYLTEREISFTEMVNDFERSDEIHVEKFKAKALYNSLLVLKDGNDLTFVTQKKITARNEFITFKDFDFDPAILAQKTEGLLSVIDLAFNMAGGKIQQQTEFEYGGYTVELTLAKNEKQQTLMATKRGINVRWVHVPNRHTPQGLASEVKYALSYRMVFIKN